MLNSKQTTIGLLVILMTASCVRSPKNPGREYIPDMGRAVAYEGYFENPGDQVLANGMNAQLPPKGAIAQSFEVYPFENSVQGYEAAGESYANEFNFAEEEIASEGKRIFNTYCAICHGEKGDGNGHLVQIEKYPPPPSYFREDIVALPDGKRYHSVMFGKGLMGSYATQIDHRERWLVLEYVRTLQEAHLAKEAKAAEAETNGEG